jgi:hypothetical protein
MLTQKEELSIEYVLQGMTQTDAVEKVYNCKNRDSAKALASKLFKKEKVNQRLTEKQALLDEKTTQMTADFLMLVKQNIPPIDVINRLKTILQEGGSRETLTAIDQYIKIIGGYKDKETKFGGMFQGIKG